MYKVAIVGSRTFNNYDVLEKSILSKIDLKDISLIISGGAKGADKLGEVFANNNGISKTVFYPDWEKYGKKAGFVRNHNIIEFSDVVFCFWDYKSKGTKHSIDLSKKYGKILYIINVENYCG